MSINFRLAAGLLGVFVLTACMGTLSHPVEIPPEEVECDENGNKVCTQTNAAAQPAVPANLRMPCTGCWRKIPLSFFTKAAAGTAQNTGL